MELPTEAADEFSISLLGPGPNREFTIQEMINFDWFWPTQPGAGRHFVVYLSDDAQEFALGSVNKPNNGAAYRLTVPGEELPITGENLTWQVRLEDIGGGEVFVASDPVPIIIRSGEPTATPTGTLPAVTNTAEPTPCVPSPPPGWVQYTIREGDSLSELAERGNVEVETLLQVNCLPNILLSVGQPIFVPSASVPRTPTPRPTATNPPPPPPTATNPPPPPPPTNTRAPEPPTATTEPTATSAPPTSTSEPPTSTPGVPPTETQAPP
jgi:LysM repeat protein